MSIIKRTIIVLLAISVLLSIVSCSKSHEMESNIAEEETTFATQIESTTETTSNQETDVSIETTTIDEPSNYLNGYDPIAENIGKYVVVEYNPMYCSIESEVKQNVGSKETVVLKVTMHDGYIFDGWSTGDYICNKTKGVGVINKETYSLTVNSTTKVFVNCSMHVKYDCNGGLTKDKKSTLDTTYCVSEYKCPSTLPDKGYFSREGYVLSEYNTEPDGSGKAVSMGSKIRSDSSSLTLYCIWLKEDSFQDFEYTKGSGVTITGYKGNKKDVVIPEKIDGLDVTTIAKKAFHDVDIETVFLPKTIETVNRGSFYKCNNLSSIVFFDNILSFDKDSIAECPSFKHVRINAVLDMYYGWMTGTYCKTDRLIWAENMKKFIFYGGSGTLHAIKCDMVKEEIGEDYFIINMGANANVSSAFVFEGIKKWLKEDDIILWCPEASGATLGKTDMTGSLGMRNIEVYVCGNYDFLKGVDVSQYQGFFDVMMTVFSQHPANTTSWEMGSIGYNCYGDSVSAPKQQLFDNSYNLPIVTSSAYSRMQMMIKEMKAIGVDVWFSYGVMDETGTGFTKETVKQYEESIKNTFDVTIISDFWDCLVPHDCMADSKWHVTLEGAQIRTTRIIKDILNQFEKVKST